MAADPHHYVYCLCASDADFYGEMAVVSAWLLRRVAPEARITLLIDEVSDAQPPSVLTQLRDLVHEHCVIRTGGETAVVRSRLLKVAARQVVEGDFVYLDADTLPVRPLDGLWVTKADVAGVRNPNGYSDCRARHFKRYRELGWGDSLPMLYLNSGVLLFRDTTGGREVGRLWEEFYHESAASGEPRDQLALAHAIASSAARVSVLPERYNAMIFARNNQKTVRNASIIHTWAGAGATRFEAVDRSVLHRAAKSLKRTGGLDTSLLERFLMTGDPWMEAKTFRDHLALREYRHAVHRAAIKVLQRPLARSRR